ncbi:unknown protein [Seminavis robusta]|uniref:Uncharacterized protein n=1 Tax=Seminavis robusta TaxID=568900 RepID=A0A9N8DT59_9STRA|nr:unknown protein [Seminavis robusta]|eukprot:Sro269_g104081.1  (254) ;mRNA; r:60903-61664
MLHHSRELLHASHSIFPVVADPKANPDDEPVSLKKLLQGEGVWIFRKEILGWIFDSISRTIELPPGKIDKIRTAINKVLHTKHCQLTDLQSLMGKLQHSCLEIITGKLAPLYKLLPATHSKTSHQRGHISVPQESEAYNALQDIHTMLKIVANWPTTSPQDTARVILVWKSRLISSICLATADAEYDALTQLLEVPHEMWVTITSKAAADNSAALILARDHALTSRTRYYYHTQAHHFWQHVGHALNVSSDQL